MDLTTIGALPDVELQRCKPMKLSGSWYSAADSRTMQLDERGDETCDGSLRILSIAEFQQPASSTVEIC